MAQEVRLYQRQEQRLALLPQMLQSIEVLQLTTADLLAYVDAELQQNETLELLRPAREPEVKLQEPLVERPDSGWDGEWRRGSSTEDEDGKAAWLQNLPAKANDLLEAVRGQLTFRDLPEGVGEAVLALAEQLDERGFLVQPLPQLAAALGLPLDRLELARAVLLTLEPRGLGAGDAIEAMLVQSSDDPDLPLIERILKAHLPALQRNRLPEVAFDVGLTLDELQCLLTRMRHLTPRPAGEFTDQAAESIIPDAYVAMLDGRPIVSLDEDSLPELGVVADYARLAADRSADRALRAYLRPKLRAARDLIGAISHRQQTLARVVEAVMKEQAAFLARGKSGIKPLRMCDVASKIGLHTSTVSRAIAGKYVQTERGLFALRDFFDGSRMDAQQKAGQGRMAVAEQIQELIAAEDKGVPLSDDDLVAALLARGVMAARRTVTKYRQELGIPSSYRRRIFGGDA